MSGPPAALRSRARFPDVGLEQGHYESFYLTASHPAGGVAVWLRHTVLKAPQRQPVGSLWLTVFDRGAPAPVAVKASYPAEELSASADSYIAIGDAVLGANRAAGSLDAGGRGQASWNLVYEAKAPAFPYLARSRLYDAPVPRTKALAVHPIAVFSGSVDIDGRRLEIDRWPGMVGHNWGREHAYRSSWLHGTGFAQDATAYFDAVLARIKIGPFVTPWIGNGCLWLDGRLRRLGGLSPTATRFHDAAGSARFELRGGELTVTGEVGAPTSQFVAWRYGHPDGGWHPTLHCSVADMRLTVRSRAGVERALTAGGAAAYEVQLRPQAELPVEPQPFGDDP